MRGIILAGGIGSRLNSQGKLYIEVLGLLEGWGRA